MLILRVLVPIASFRVAEAGEYARTYPVPPPATIYGFLLSLIGEVDRYQHQGAELAVGLLRTPIKSTVLRTFRRAKTRRPEDPQNSRPDYQEVLTGLDLLVGVRGGGLEERVSAALLDPASVTRFGGLSLGESRDLVDTVTLANEFPPAQWLVTDPSASLTLPTWSGGWDRGAPGRGRFSLQDAREVPEEAWVKMQAPETVTAGW